MICTKARHVLAVGALAQSWHDKLAAVPGTLTRWFRGTRLWLPGGSEVEFKVLSIVRIQLTMCSSDVLQCNTRFQSRVACGGQSNAPPQTPTNSWNL